MKDVVVTGRKYRVLKDKKTKIWKVISWWTSAEDVEFADGRKLQDVFGGIHGVVNENMNSAVNVPTSSVVYSLFKSLKDSITSLTQQMTNNGTITGEKLSVKHIFKSGSTTNIEREELLKPLDFASSTMNKVGTKAYFGDGAGKGKEGLFCIKGFNTQDPDSNTGIGFLTTRAKGSGASSAYKELGTITYDGESFYFTHKIDSPTIDDINNSIKEITTSIENLSKKNDDYTNVVNTAVDAFNKDGMKRIADLESYKSIVASKIGSTADATGSYGTSINNLQQNLNSKYEAANNALADFRDKTYAQDKQRLETRDNELDKNIGQLQNSTGDLANRVKTLEDNSLTSNNLADYVKEIDLVKQMTEINTAVTDQLQNYITSEALSNKDYVTASSLNTKLKSYSTTASTTESIKSLQNSMETEISELKAWVTKTFVKKS